MSILATSSFAQSPAPISSSPVVARAWPSPSPSATPTTEDLINSLGQVDLQAVITLLKSNFTNPDAITDAELTRATVQGLITRLPHGIMLLPGKESKPPEAPSPFYSEILGGHIGYLRVGALDSANLQALDKALSSFTGKKVDALIVDLRASSVAKDLTTAADFAKRFCPKGKLLFTLHKPAARQDRTFNSDHESASQGLVMVLADADTVGAHLRNRRRTMRSCSARWMLSPQSRFIRSGRQDASWGERYGSTTTEKSGRGNIPFILS